MIFIQLFGLILHMLLLSFGSFTGLVLLAPLCPHKRSKLIEFTNFPNRFVYLIASSHLDGGHPPLVSVVSFLRVSVCLFRMVHSLIGCSVLWGPFCKGITGSIIFELCTVRTWIDLG
jgi:hypothetical protein